MSDNAQALPPTDAEQAQTLRTANGQLRTRVAELEAIVDRLRRGLDEARAELRELRRLRTDAVMEANALLAILRDARIYVDCMTIQVGPVAHNGIEAARRLLRRIDAALGGAGTV